MPLSPRLPHCQDQAFLEYLLLLRYGSTTDINHLQPVLNITSVARVVNKPVSSVAKLLKLALCAYMMGIEVSERKRRKFKGEHIAFLVSKQTLISQAHLSLKQRAKMFHR